MKEALVGLVVQLRLGPEFGPDNGMGDREGLIDALCGFLGDWPSTDSGSRSTNIKCWDVRPERWDETLAFTVADTAMSKEGQHGRKPTVQMPVAGS